MSERIKITVESGVADVRLARPEKINALDQLMFEGIVEAIATLDAMAGLRCVVLSGEGRGFCAGIDLYSLQSNPALSDLRARTHGKANVFQQIAWGWRNLHVPVIAAVHGFAFGAGFQMMLGTDIRIAAPDAQLSMMELRWGLVPDVAGIALLRGLVRDDIARVDADATAILAAESEEQQALLASRGHAEALAASREKRVPIFDD
jgi:enoyl-CoA hydratase/carnithine racemase